jgi:aspartate-semialdehyde dehydrogenase
VEILGNVIPWIGGEEEKIRREAALVLGREFPIGVQVNRVPVMHGHLASLVIECDRELTEPELRAIYTDFAAPPDVARLPTSPPEAVVLVAGEDRPQPLLDVDQGRGMTVSVGRLRVEGSTVRLVALGHNLVRGAAGAAVLNAELAVSQGYLASPAGKPASGWRHLSRVDRTSPPPSIRSHP